MVSIVRKVETIGIFVATYFRAVSADCFHDRRAHGVR